MIPIIFLFQPVAPLKLSSSPPTHTPTKHQKQTKKNNKTNIEAIAYNT